MFAHAFTSMEDYRGGRSSPLGYVWRRWGWLTLWVVPAMLTLELIGLAGCWLAPRGGLLEALALVVVLVPLGIAGVCVAAAVLAGLVMLVAGPWRWARQRTADWYSSR